MSDKPPYDRDVNLMMLDIHLAGYRLGMSKAITLLMELAAHKEDLAAGLVRSFPNKSAAEIKEVFDVAFELIRAPIDIALEQLKKEENSNEQR